MKTEILDNIVEKMRSIGDQLVPYNFPRVKGNVEDQVENYKLREIVIDGYKVVLHYNKADYGSYYLEILQVKGSYALFLPFEILTKLAIKFLGGHNLSLVEFYKDGYKVYCWTVFVDKSGKPISFPEKEKCELCSYRGLEYYYLQPNQVSFY